MIVKDLNISPLLQRKLNLGGHFLFNPSITHIKGNIFLISFRAFIHDKNKPSDDNPILAENTQHPWNANWKGQDVTYILPITMIGKRIKLIINDDWPFILPVQDARLIKVIKINNNEHCVRGVGVIITFNQQYSDRSDMSIKDTNCEDGCYLIDWGMIAINFPKLNFKYIPSEHPLCLNASHRVEKNWSVWHTNTNLYISYSLTPSHTVYSFNIEQNNNDTITTQDPCRLLTNNTAQFTFFEQLQQYYKNNLIVSLSTPATNISGSIYQAVGHIKIKRTYLNNLQDDSPLSTFYKQLENYQNKHFHQTYIYLMFIYRFDSNTFNIINATPAFVCKVTAWDYLLNFPSGMVVTKNHTIISYGNGDYTSHLMYINNSDMDNFMIPLNSIKVSEYPFLHRVKSDGLIIF